MSSIKELKKTEQTSQKSPGCHSQLSTGSERYNVCASTAIAADNTRTLRPPNPCTTKVDNACQRVDSSAFTYSEMGALDMWICLHVCES